MAVYARGGDPQAMRGAARRLAGHGSALASVGQECEAACGRLNLQWAGADHATTDSLLRRIRVTIGDLGAAVQRLSDTLDRNAAQQEAASDSGGGRGDGNGGGIPGPRGAPAIRKAPNDDGTLDPWVAARWQSMTTPERVATLQQMANGIAATTGIPPRRVVVAPLASPAGYRTLGEAGIGRDFLTLSPDAVADPVLAINALGHEMQHAVQFQLVTEEMRPDPIVSTLRSWGVLPDHPTQVGVTAATVKRWEANLFDYQDVETHGYAAYRNQPIEADAFRAGKAFVNQMDPVTFSLFRLSALGAPPTPVAPAH